MLQIEMKYQKSMVFSLKLNLHHDLKSITSENIIASEKSILFFNFMFYGGKSSVVRELVLFVKNKEKMYISTCC